MEAKCYIYISKIFGAFHSINTDGISEKVIPVERFRVGFRFRVTFACVCKHEIFTRVNKIEAGYKELNLYVKLSEVQLLLLRATIQDHSSIASILFENVNFTHPCDNGSPPLAIKLGLTLERVFLNLFYSFRSFCMRVIL